ncbi:hypothetical protein VVR85_02180 [Corynebacterium sp. LK2590]|uniref:hypothetical protein n=1 Tax=unclassified Corynebacterium TaxID=2624378 RepID=UPI0034CECFAC
MTRLFGLSHWLRRPSVWLVIVGLAILLVPLEELTSGGYGQSALAQATVSFFVAVPASVCAVAWEASRFRALRPLSPRTGLKIFASRAGGFIFVPLAGFLLGLVLLLPGSSAPNLSTLTGMVLYCLVVGLAWSVVGFCLGLMLRPVFAILLGVAVPYVWYALTPALQPGRLRVLTGDFTACCALDRTIDPQAVLVAALSVSALALAVLGLTAAVSRGRVHVGVPLSVGASVVSAVLAFALAGTVGVGGGKPRAAEEIRCVDEVCTWPEVPEHNVELNVQALDEINELVPEGLRPRVTGPVVWDAASGGQLLFSGAEHVDGVLGDFIDQVAVGYLSQAGVAVCGRDPQGLSSVRTMEPWPMDKPLSVEAVQQRLEETLCPPADATVRQGG